MLAGARKQGGERKEEDHVAVEGPEGATLSREEGRTRGHSQAAWEGRIRVLEYASRAGEGGTGEGGARRWEREWLGVWNA